MKAIFSDGDKTTEMKLTKAEIDLIVKHKPGLDFEGDSWVITDFRFCLDEGVFRFWIEKF